MLAGALSALCVVAVLAFVRGHTAFGDSEGDRGEGACRNRACNQSRCVRARNVSRGRDRRGVTPPCPPVRGNGGEEEHTRPQPRWRFVPRPGP